MTSHSPPRSALHLNTALTALLLGWISSCAGQTTPPAQNAISTAHETAAPPRVLMVLTSHGELGQTGEGTGFYLSELTHPYAVFEEAGVAMDLVSPEGGEPPMDGVKRDDPLNAAFLDSPEKMARVRTTRSPDAVRAPDYDAIFFVGGHGAMWDLAGHARLAQLTREIYEAGGVVAAVCHGPAGITEVSLSDGTTLVAGKRVTSFTNAEEAARELTAVVPFLLETRLRERGGEFSSAENFEANVVVDGRLITGQNPASAAGVAEAVVAQLRAPR